MYLKLSGSLVRKIESFLVIILLLFSDLFDIPQNITSLINGLSYLIVAFLVFRKPGRILYIIQQNLSLLLLTGFAMFSIVWSASPEVTLDQIRALMRSFLLGAYIATSFSLEEQLQLYSYPFRITAILSLVAVLLFPAYATHMPNTTIDWKGIYIHKQYLGRAMALGASIFLILSIKNWGREWSNYFFLILSLIMVWFSHSKTSLVMVLLLASTLPLYNLAKQKNYKLRFSLLISILFIISSLAALLIINLETIVVDILGKNLELNGRLPIWTEVIQKGIEHPLLGYGYGGFWNSNSGRDIANNTWGKELLLQALKTGTPFTWHSHNGFLELFIQLGLIGLVLFFTSFIGTVRRITILLVTTHSLEFFWMFQFLALTLTVNLSEIVTILAPNNTFWILYISLSLSCVMFYKRTFRKLNIELLEAMT